MSPRYHPLSAKLPATSEDNSSFVADTFASGTITQITGVPKRCTRNLMNIGLVDFNGFDTWLDDVTRVLRQKNLHRLIDADIEHPPATSPHAARWEKVSKDVRAWLFQAVSEDINGFVCCRPYRCDFADEYIEALKKTFKKTGYLAASADCVTLWTIRRNQYSTNSEFEEAFRDQYAKLGQRVTISPFFLSQVVLHEIRYDNPTLVTVEHAIYDRTYTNAEDFSAKDLLRLFNNLIRELQNVENSHAAASIKNPNSS
ncbi:hypothetical protein PENSUB_12873 [Penicillium subrubescens]|uniref:Uncharacterized protein n=1 Tax=Penicillium subrubescens TaxID=1316194 RepID=A0A1Q5SWB2_9EURO|nr:hypothetical protein PENSUB_12873 [Penicillium subrubescens]